MRALVVALVLCPWLFAPALIAGGAGCASQGEPASAAAMRLAPCKVAGIGRLAECGRLEVAEDPDKPEGRKLSLSVVRLPARGPSAAPEPLFLLAGGPGQAASEAFAPMLDALDDIAFDRDLVMVDIRGTGTSAPLDCDMPDDLASEFRPGALAELARGCRPRLEADLTKYTTDIIADDLDRVRLALGYERIHLLGVSYGTRLAMVYARRHPQSAASLVLDGAAPPWMALPSSLAEDAQVAFERIVARCDAAPACAAAYPQLSAKLRELLERLPQSITVPDPKSGEPVTFEMPRAGFAMALRSLLYSPELHVLLPLSIAKAHAGDMRAFVAQATVIADGAADQASLGLLLSVVCAEDVPRVEPESGDAPDWSRTFVGTALVDEFRAACAEWPRAPIAPVFYERTPIDVPALVLSGELDPVTPERWGTEVLATLPRGRHLVVPGMGHSVSMRSCVPRLIRELMRQPDGFAAVDASCIADDALPFFVDGAGPAH